MSDWIDICAKNQIVADTGICAKVGDRQVAVFHQRGGRLYAIGNYCPFAKANVLSRGLLVDLSGELAVASPIYKQRFNLETGICLDDESVSVPVYQVREVDGRVEVALTQSAIQGDSFSATGS